MKLSMQKKNPTVKWDHQVMDCILLGWWTGLYDYDVAHHCLTISQFAVVVNAIESLYDRPLGGCVVHCAAHPFFNPVLQSGVPILGRKGFDFSFVGKQSFGCDGQLLLDGPFLVPIGRCSVVWPPRRGNNVCKRLLLYGWISGGH